MAKETEEFEGYVVDIACIRKYAQTDLAERARAHSRECALMGHCIESGYGLVSDDGAVRLLEPSATPAVVEAVQHSTKERGIKLKAHRERQDESMHTTSIDEVS